MEKKFGTETNAKYIFDFGEYAIKLKIEFLYLNIYRLDRFISSKRSFNNNEFIKYLDIMMGTECVEMLEWVEAIVTGLFVFVIIFFLVDLYQNDYYYKDLFL